MADEKPVQPKSRIVKNPETFRERAVKANEQAAKPSRKQAVVAAPVRVIVKVVSLIAKPFAWSGKTIGATKAGRILGKPLKVLGRILLPRYVRNAWVELRQVTWPTWLESRRLTFAVLVFAVAFGVAIAIVDFGLDRLFKALLLK